MIAGGGLRGEIIDRVLAVVEGSVITQSDVLAAIRLGLVQPGRTADPVGAVLDRLIDRRLTLAEVDRYAPPNPAESAIDSRVAAVRASAGSADFDKLLAQFGLTMEQLRRHLRDDLRITAYLLQRFGADILPSEEQVLDYYRQHPEQFSARGVVRPFDEAHDDVRAALIAEQQAQVIRDWLAGLRQRADVAVLYAPGQP
jgi:hypothetical protein